jgi:predicted ABC-type ATPase
VNDTSKPPAFYLIAGPNGAGKTTFARQYLPERECPHFVNADEIARDLSPNDVEAAAAPAARQALTTMRRLASTHTTFAAETTLSGRSYLRFVRDLKANGCHTVLHFLWLPDWRMASQRVRERVIKGGHNIPVDVIERRYRAGLQNLFELYMPIFDVWLLWNSSVAPPSLVAKRSLEGLTIQDPKTYTRIKEAALK